MRLGIPNVFLIRVLPTVQNEKHLVWYQLHSTPLPYTFSLTVRIIPSYECYRLLLYTRKQYVPTDWNSIPCIIWTDSGVTLFLHISPHNYCNWFCPHLHYLWRNICYSFILHRKIFDAFLIIIMRLLYISKRDVALPAKIPEDVECELVNLTATLTKPLDIHRNNLNL